MGSTAGQEFIIWQIQTLTSAPNVRHPIKQH